MTPLDDPDVRRAVRLALARADYAQGRVRIAQHDLRGYDWLVTTAYGVFAIGGGRAVAVIHGWFFGINWAPPYVYLFQNCGHRDRESNEGRLIRLTVADGRIVDAAVLVTGLHNNCHQLRLIDDLLCLVDTANQRILRFTVAGEPVDTRAPFPHALPSNTSGGYHHMNSIAKIDGRIALMLHNGKAVPDRPSELAWLDAEWRVTDRVPLPGRCCHDIVADEAGVLWHCGSYAGELIASDGRRVRLSDQLMTRGLAFKPDALLVGLSGFGPRENRDALRGAVVLLDRAFNRLDQIALPSGPADIVAL